MHDQARAWQGLRGVCGSTIDHQQGIKTSKEAGQFPAAVTLLDGRSLMIRGGGVRVARCDTLTCSNAVH